MLNSELIKLKNQLEKGENIEVDRANLLRELNKLVPSENQAKFHMKIEDTLNVLKPYTPTDDCIKVSPENITNRDITPQANNTDQSKAWFYVKKGKDGDYNILFIVNPNSFKEDIPENLINLYVEIEDTLSVLKSLINTDNNIKNNYYERLFTLSEVGLGSNIPQPKLASRSLTELKEEMILIEGKRIKN